MVKLSLSDFADATNRMIELSGLARTRLVVKLRPSEKTIYLKSTDQRSTLTTTATEQKDLKLVERIIGDYVTRCTRSAPLEPLAASDKKSANQKAKKGKGGTKSK